MPADRLLVVDDNPANLKLMRLLLASEGYEVLTAVDAAQALEVLQRDRPRLVFMDIQLPGMDGLTLTRRIKGDPATRDTVVVALTAYAMRGDAERAVRAGCDGYIAKPLDTRALPGLIRSYLDGKRPQVGASHGSG